MQYKFSSLPLLKSVPSQRMSNIRSLFLPLSFQRVLPAEWIYFWSAFFYIFTWVSLTWITNFSVTHLSFMWAFWTSHRCMYVLCRFEFGRRIDVCPAWVWVYTQFWSNTWVCLMDYAFNFFFFSFYVYVCFTCMDARAPHACLLLKDTGRGHRVPGTGVVDNYKLSL